jgi:hypothetical protein
MLQNPEDLCAGVLLDLLETLELSLIVSLHAHDLLLSLWDFVHLDSEGVTNVL